MLVEGVAPLGSEAVGRLVVEAIFNRDFPVVQGVVLVVSLIFVAVSVVVDLAYAALDPRLRSEAA